MAAPQPCFHIIVLTTCRDEPLSKFQCQFSRHKNLIGPAVLVHSTETNSEGPKVQTWLPHSPPPATVTLWKKETVFRTKIVLDHQNYLHVNMAGFRSCSELLSHGPCATRSQEVKFFWLWLWYLHFSPLSPMSLHLSFCDILYILT